MNKLIEKSITIMFLFILMIIYVSADAGHPVHTNFEQAEGIINAELSCDSLSDEQLELLGDYYMEQMHPGEAHIQMDEIMGGEGSESLKEVHIRMANSIYCENNTVMMSMMSGMSGSGIMGDSQTNGEMMNVMETNWMYGRFGFMWIIMITIVAFIFGIIFWWTKKLVFKENKKR